MRAMVIKKWPQRQFTPKTNLPPLKRRLSRDSLRIRPGLVVYAQKIDPLILATGCFLILRVLL
jgi:hypothetical protein